MTELSYRDKLSSKLDQLIYDELGKPVAKIVLDIYGSLADNMTGKVKLDFFKVPGNKPVVKIDENNVINITFEDGTGFITFEDGTGLITSYLQIEQENINNKCVPSITCLIDLQNFVCRHYRNLYDEVTIVTYDIFKIIFEMPELRELVCDTLKQLAKLMSEKSHRVRSLPCIFTLKAGEAPDCNSGYFYKEIIACPSKEITKKVKAND